MRRVIAFILLLFFALVPARAQGSTFGLSDQDFALFSSASAATSALNSFQFDYSLRFSLTGTGSNDASVEVEGEGALDLNADTPSLRLTLMGSASVPDETPIDAEIRVIDEVLYATVLNPATGERLPWEGMTLDELATQASLAATDQESSLSLENVAFTTNMESALSAFNPGDFITLSRLEDESLDGAETAHFSANLDVNELVSSDALIDLLGVFASAGETTGAGVDMSTVAPMLGTIFSASKIVFEPYFGLDDNLLRRVVLNADVKLNPALLGLPEEITVFLNLDVTLSDHDQAQSIMIPEGVTVLSVSTSDQISPTEDAPAVAATVSATGSEAIAANAPVVVNLTPDGPVDLRYSGSADEIISVTARSLEVSGVLDTTVEVLNTDGNRLAFNDDHGDARAGLDTYDSSLPDLRLRSDGDVIIRVDSFNSASTGRVEVLVASGNAAVVTPTPAATPEGVSGTITGVLPDNENFDHTFSAQAGDIVTISVRATDNVLDPKVALIDPTGTVIAQNDDHGTDDVSLGRYDSQIREFTVVESGSYTVRISGYAGTGGTFELTIEQSGGGIVPTATPTVEITPTQVLTSGLVMVEGAIEPNGSFTYDLSAQAGDVYTITVRAVNSELDPRVSVYDSEGKFLFSNDDHGTSDPGLAPFDARITHLILPETGDYLLEVSGYQDSSGDFEMTLEHVATGAPLGRGTDQVFTGEISANGTFSQTFDAQAGDFVTVSVRALNQDFDPRMQLLSPDGVIVADNDDHGTGVGDLGFLDSRVQNYIVPESGTYTVEVQGYRDSAGSFAVTVTTLR